MHPEHRSIGELAYRLWLARGCPEGSAERDWLDAEKQLRSALQDTFPPSDPPASRRPDEPPANADAKWKAARAPSKASAGRSRRSKSAQDKPSAEPPG
jgi:hypothetical protein